MKPASSLYVQIFSRLFVFLLALATIGFVAFNAQFGIGWEALLNSPLGDRVETVADSVESQMWSTSASHWNEILRNSGKKYGAKFFVFDATGTEVAGENIALPQPVKDRFVDPHFVHDANFFPQSPPPYPGPGTKGSEHGPPGAIFGHSPPPADMVFGHGKPGEPPMQSHGVHMQGRFVVRSSRPDRIWFVILLPVMSNSGCPMPGAIIASPENIWQTGLFIDFAYAGTVALVVIVLSLLFWCPMIYQITRALSDVTATTELIAEGDFHARVATRRSDEIGRLADAVNSMAERLDTFVTRQRRMLGDISHELVSPIARLQMALELLSVNIPGEKMSLVADINEEVVEMNNLVNELLAYSKAGVKGPDIELVEINLHELFDRLIERVDPNKAVDVQVPEDVTVLGDPVLLERSFANILRNSIRYAGDRGPITVTVPIIASHVSVLISDRGPGVPDEALKQLAEPFYRPEFSRSRDTGGVGLGLAIVKTCVEACGGSLSFRNRLSGGFEVEIRLKQRRLLNSMERKVRQVSS